MTLSNVNKMNIKSKKLLIMNIIKLPLEIKRGCTRDTSLNAKTNIL